MLISELSLSLIAGLFVNLFKASQELLNQQKNCSQCEYCDAILVQTMSFCVALRWAHLAMLQALPVTCTVQALTEGCPNDHQ